MKKLPTKKPIKSEGANDLENPSTGPWESLNLHNAPKADSKKSTPMKIGGIIPSEPKKKGRRY